MSKQLLAVASALALAASTLSEAITAAAGGATDTGADTKTDSKTTKTTSTKTTKAKGYEPKYTKAEAHAAVTEMKEKKGVAAAKKLIKDLGYEKLADIEKAEDLDLAYEAAKEALGEGDDGDGEDDDV